MAPLLHPVNPATGAALDPVSTTSDDEIESAIAAAHALYLDWRTRSVDSRTDVLLRAAALYRERAESLAELISIEMGKPISQARGEIAVSADIFEYYAENAVSFTQDEPIPVRSGGTAVVRTEPIGALLGIMPWNYPHYQVARFAAPNLALGNPVIVKH
ncbi:MAG TPA: succinate-semialdehyde dehydrogenase, partial [Microbacterium sp.]|nr:succinate-semialdehyde dehydrogenase [Microbacterium sp.]